MLERFIPAGAGNRRWRRYWPGRMAVHPRWRGEQISSRTARTGSCGSSPLARGTVVRRRDVGCSRRFIPAGAGNSLEITAIDGDIAVHPRWRGEQRYRDDKRIFRVRFIPAGAGNSRWVAGQSRLIAVHPRWRGEQWRDRHSLKHAVGSSPLARGTGAAPGSPSWHLRFIPAGAGNSSHSAVALRMAAVHPRWRGEQFWLNACACHSTGSSPLARGTECAG